MITKEELPKRAPATVHCLTHDEYASDCAQAAREKRRHRQFVQADINGSVECGIIRDAFTTPKPRSGPSIDMWKIEVMEGMNKGKHNVHVTKVRRCSNLDGRCNCAKEH